MHLITETEFAQIPITRPDLDQADVAALADPVESGWLVQGPKVAEFENRVADFTGIEHAVATTSCTTSLHLALIAAGIGPGDHVIVPAFTWVATANVVEYVGARPILCDIDPVTFNMTAEQVERVLTPESRAIIPVHLFGLCVPMDEIGELASRHNLEIIEDAACAFGSTLNGLHPGAFGSSACYSFHPRKAITTGEGGMILTRDPQIASVCRTLRDHGAAVSDLARHNEKGGYLLSQFSLLGYNYRMTDLQGALGVSQMEKADRILNGRKSRAAVYNERLRGVENLQIPTPPQGNEHAYQSYVCSVGPRQVNQADVAELHTRRVRLMATLESQNIATRQGTHAVHTLAYYREKYGLSDSDYPNAYAADRLSLTLPLYAGMTDAEQDRVIEALTICLNEEF